jgi:DNA polymerase-3 subunit gamma/tau
MSFRPAVSPVGEAPDPAAAVEMVLIRLAYASDLPGPEEALKALRSGEEAGPPSPRPIRGGGPSGALARSAPEPARPAPSVANPQSFEDVVRLIAERRDVGLRLDVEKYVRPISFRPGAIGFEPAVGAPGNLAHRLASQLKAWTGQPWLVAAEGGGGAETLLERQKRAQDEARDEAMSEPFVQAVMDAFPGAEIIDVRQVEIPATTPSDDAPELED